MAFYKVFVVVFVLFLVATTAHARQNLFDDSSAGLGQVTHGAFCSTCTCRGIIRPVCTRTDFKQDTCPFACGNDDKTCLCDLKYPRTCRCSYRVETCNPYECIQPFKTTLVEVLTSFPTEN